MLSATLKKDLERRGEGARRLQLALFRVDGAVSRIAVGTSRPMREPALIGRLFHERLTALEGDIDAGYGFDLVRLAVLSSTRIEDAQTDLAGDTIDAGEDLALFADRIRARLGDNAVLAPVMVESHIPERATVQVPFGERPEMAKGGSLASPGRGIGRNARSGSSATRSRSTSLPRSPKGRPPVSTGAVPSTASPPRKGRSASHRNGGGTRRALRHATISASRMRTGAATGSIAKDFTAVPKHCRAGSCTGSSHERDCLHPLCRVRHPVEFLVPARRLQARGAGGDRQPARPFRDRPCRSQHGGRRRARLAAVEGCQTSLSSWLPPRFLRTARPTSSPIPRIGRAGGISAAC